MFVFVKHTQLLIKTDCIKRIVAGLENKTKLILAPFLMLIIVGMGVNYAYATTLSDSIKELGMPDITINPESGPVGTELTINVSNLPMPPDDADPRLEFYMYLPASEAYGSFLTKCDGHCIVLYSFDDIRNNEIYPKEITFTLPSVKNPDPYSVQLSVPDKDSASKQGTVITSVCDVIINDKIVFKFGYSCNNYDVPVGEYEIDFGWAVGMSDVYDKSQSVTFTVTDESYQPKGFSYDTVAIAPTEWSAGSSSLIFKKFEQGEMTKTQFLTALKNQGWTTEGDIRRALAFAGELEHQDGINWVDWNSKANSLVSVVDNSPKANIIIPVVENNSGSSLSKTSAFSEIDDIGTTVVYALAIGGAITGGAIFAAFRRNIF